MGLLTGSTKRLFGVTSTAELIPRRSTSTTMPHVTPDQAMHQSAVWACLRLRADLVSTLPCDVFRDIKIDGTPHQLEVPKPKILISTGGDDVGYMEWMYMSQTELDKSGNFIGIIRELDGNGYPARIDAQASASCTIKVKGNEIEYYRIGDTVYQPQQIWHERQYSLAGSPVGLSPVAYAAFTLGEYKSVQDFIIGWFTGGAVPRSRLKNIERTIDEDEALLMKEAWRAARSMDEPFVHGADWEYNLIASEQASADWMNAKNVTTVDIARFFGVPADLIDAAVSGQSVTYANITQRNLQFLIMNLGPAIIRREYGLSNLLPKPRYVKLNSNALLRMDSQTRGELLARLIVSRQLAPSEARALENRLPYTDSQLAEFEKFWPAKAAPTPIPANLPQNIGG